ncbi:TPA: hypothetical protein ACH3X2_002612 [Trebouxia sp. C0005]
MLDNLFDQIATTIKSSDLPLNTELQQAEQMQGACTECVKTRVHPPLKTDDEFIEVFEPFANLTLERGISPDRTIEIVFDVLHDLARLNQPIERATLIVCMDMAVLKVLEHTKDQPAALPGAEGVGKDEAAYITALSDRDHVVDVLAAWLDAKEKQYQKQIDDAVEKRIQANKPNPSTGRADTEMNAPEDGLATDETAADEAVKQDEPDAMDRWWLVPSWKGHPQALMIKSRQ